MLNIIVILLGMIFIGIAVSNWIFSKSKGKKLVTLIFTMMGLITFLISASFVIIPTGYTGVRTTFGQISEKSAPIGFNWKIPFIQKIEKMNIKQQDVVFSELIYAETINRTDVTFKNVTVTIQYNSDKASWIYANVSNYSTNLLTSDMLASAIKDGSKTLQDVDVTNRSLIEPMAIDNIQNALNEKYGMGVVHVIFVAIQDVDFTAEYNQAIANKQAAQLAYETQQIDNQKAIELAQAAAKSKLIEANATAEANKIISDSLSDKVLLNKLYDKWNGELSKVTGGTSTMFDVSSIIENKE